MFIELIKLKIEDKEIKRMVKGARFSVEVLKDRVLEKKSKALK